MKKKILIIHHSGVIGGAGVTVYNTIMALQDDYDVVIYCPSNPSDFSEYLMERDINVKTFDFPVGSIHYYSGGSPVLSPGFINGIVNIIKYRKRWDCILKTENPELVIADSKILAGMVFAFRKNNQKSVCYVQETRKKSILNIWNNIQRGLLDKFNGVVFISKYDQDMESLKKAQSIVVPNFISINSFKPNKGRSEACKHFNVDPNSFNILFVGGMLRIKGFDIAVNSLKYLKDLNVKLIVAGDSEFHYKHEKSIYSRLYNFLKGRYEKSINQIITDNNLQSSIIKIGVQKDMTDVYTLADVLIFPATTPHQARPVFEAGAMKVPAIMPDFDNTLEYISHGVNGLIFKRKDPRSLADNIKILIKDEKYRKHLGEKNYEYTLINHTKDTSEKLLKEMIGEILTD